MNSRLLIRHPGAESVERVVSATGFVTTHSVTLLQGSNLLAAVSQLMDNIKCDSGVMILDGAQLGPFNYVMPDNSHDDLHAAWYSNTHSCHWARLRNATAIIGKRNAQWWLHCHALWDGHQSEDGHNDGQLTAMGHLLPDEVIIAKKFEVTLYAFTNGCFNVQHDSETAFPLFHVRSGSGIDNGGGGSNAFIAKVYPHEDVYSVIEKLTIEAGFTSAIVLGIGSLIECHFEYNESMLCPISEVLTGSGATWDNETLTLPMHCVDVEGRLFTGNVIKGGSRVLVTFELLVVEK